VRALEPDSDAAADSDAARSVSAMRASVGSAPEVSIVWIAYLIGQLGNWLPLPGGIGGVEIGLIGTVVLFGLPLATATASVLLYRMIELWIPAALGVVAFAQLRLLLRRESESTELCQPGIPSRSSVADR
jgi:uncharacterized protein (TIRG00374 family)